MSILRAINLQHEHGLRRLYLAGPMTGVEEFNYPAFQREAMRLRSLGFEVVSPVEIDAVHGHDPAVHGLQTVAEYMRRDLPEMLTCDAVAVLPGWQDSRGARIETSVAIDCGLPILDAESLDFIVEEGEVDAAFDPVCVPSDLCPPGGCIECRLVDDAGLDPMETSIADGASLFPSPEPESVLQEADRLVSHDRNDDYGHPLDDFGKVVGMAKALWGRGPETEEEHAIYMVLVKIAREANRPKRDNRVDGPGYFKTLDMVISERARREAVARVREALRLADPTRFEAEVEQQ